METTLRTERLTLRRNIPADVDGMHALAVDYDVVKMTAGWPWPADKAFTASRCLPFDPKAGMAGSVFCGAELVGGMGVADTPTGPNMGYMFAQKHWGKGYATEMGRVLIDHVFATYAWPEIYASVIDGNFASGRVLEKLGFVETGTSTGPCAARGCDMAMVDYTLLRPKA